MNYVRDLYLTTFAFVSDKNQNVPMWWYVRLFWCLVSKKEKSETHQIMLLLRWQPPTNNCHFIAISEIVSKKCLNDIQIHFFGVNKKKNAQRKRCSNQYRAQEIVIVCKTDFFLVSNWRRRLAATSHDDHRSEQLLSSFFFFVCSLSSCLPLSMNQFFWQFSKMHLMNISSYKRIFEPHHERRRIRPWKEEHANHKWMRGNVIISPNSHSLLSRPIFYSNNEFK